MGRLFTCIARALKKYQDTKARPSCSARDGGSACDAMMLGSVIRALIDVALWPLPEYPYGPLTYSQLVANIKGLEFVSLCDKLRHASGHHVSKMGHGLLRELLDNIAYVEEDLFQGLEMKEFKD